MKLTIKQAVDQLQFASGKASDIARQLAFAAFAIAWIFRAPSSSRSAIPPLLATATAYATISLILDLAQYVYGVAAFQIALRKHNVAEENSVVTVAASGAVSTVFFFGKIAVIAVAYALILSYFAMTLM